MMRALGKLVTAAATASLGVALGAAPAGAFVLPPLGGGSGLGDDLSVDVGETAKGVTDAVEGEVKVDPESLAGGDVLGTIPREEVDKLLEAGAASDAGATATEALEGSAPAQAPAPAPAPMPMPMPAPANPLGDVGGLTGSSGGDPLAALGGLEGLTGQLQGLTGLVAS